MEIQPLTEGQHVDAFITDMGMSHFLYFSLHKLHYDWFYLQK